MAGFDSFSGLHAAVSSAVNASTYEFQDEARRQFESLAAKHQRRPVPWESITASGWQAAAIPEAAGGIAAGRATLAAVLVEAGRYLLNTPLLSSAGLAGGFLAAAGGDAVPYLSRIAAGAVATLAFHGPDPDDRRAWAGVDLKRGQLTGVKVLVTNADQAEFVVVPVLSDGLEAIAVVEANETAIRPTPSLDSIRPLYEVTFKGSTTSLDVLPASFAVGTALAQIALAADLVGVARGALDMAVAHASVRQQFGHPIGYFQAVKHLLADSLIAVERGESLLLAAAGQSQLDDGPTPALEQLARMAKASANEAAVKATGVNVQLHAAIAMTAEHKALGFLRRARQSAMLMGATPECYADIGRGFLAGAS